VYASIEQTVNTRMPIAIATVLKWLRSASGRISEEYMMLPVAGSDPKYRERVYCYELYHQLRCHWNSSFEYFLCGEIDKRKHAYVRGEYLDNIKPDFLIHRPGEMTSDSNLLAIEVKPANSKMDEMLDDLQKLTALRSDLKNSDNQAANYQHAIFWIYGRLQQNWNNFLDKLKNAKGRDINHQLIRCFVHSEPCKEAVEINW
jgi:hypothetical protein